MFMIKGKTKSNIMPPKDNKQQQRRTTKGSTAKETTTPRAGKDSDNDDNHTSPKRQDRENDETGNGTPQRTSNKRQKISAAAQPTPTNVEHMQEDAELGNQEMVVATPIRLTPSTGSSRRAPLTPQTSGQFAVKPKKGDPVIPLRTCQEYPTARLSTRFTMAFEHVKAAWENSAWFQEQQKANPGRIVEYISDNASDAKKAWETFVHGAHEHTYKYMDENGDENIIPGYYPTYSRAARCKICHKDLVFVESNTVLYQHYMSCKERKAHQPKKPTTTITTPLTTTATTPMDDSTVMECAVRLLAAHALPFKFFASKEVQAFLNAFWQTGGPAKFQHGRDLMRAQTINLADRDRKVLLQRMKLYPVTVAGDGGTIKKRKLLAFSVGHKVFQKGVSQDLREKGCFLWKLFTVSDQKTLSVTKRTLDVLDELRSQHIWVVVLVADNHGAMQSGFRSAGKKRGVFTIRCGCHSIQLLVGDLCEKIQNLSLADRVLELIVQSTSHQQRKELLGLNISRCTTRWHIQHDNLQQILDNRFVLKSYFSENNEFPRHQCLEEIQFQTVDEAVQTLRPFKVASRILEKDSATQLDVIAVLCGLSTTYCRNATIKSLIEGRMRKNFASEVLLCCAFGIPGLFHYLKNQAQAVYGRPAQDTAVLLSELTAKTCVKATMNYLNIMYASNSFSKCPTPKSTIKKMVQDEINHYIDITTTQFAKPWNSEDLELFWSMSFPRMQHLSKFMQAVLHAVPSEASCERVFSHSKLILDESRMALHERPTEAQTFLKFNNLKRPQSKPSKENFIQDQEGYNSLRYQEAEEAGLKNLMYTLPQDWAILADVVIQLGKGFSDQDHLKGNVTKEVWKELMAPDEDEDGDFLGVGEEEDEGDEEFKEAEESEASSDDGDN